MNEKISKQFVEMNTKLDTVQSAVQLLSRAMVTVQEKLEVIQDSLPLSSDYYVVTKYSRSLCIYFMYEILILYTRQCVISYMIACTIVP